MNVSGGSLAEAAARVCLIESGRRIHLTPTHPIR